MHRFEIFKRVAIGFAVFAILRRYIKGNLEFAETFSHELTHTIFAFLFNLQVVEFHANHIRQLIKMLNSREEWML